MLDRGLMIFWNKPHSARHSLVTLPSKGQHILLKSAEQLPRSALLQRHKTLIRECPRALHGPVEISSRILLVRSILACREDQTRSFFCPIALRVGQYDMRAQTGDGANLELPLCLQGTVERVDLHLTPAQLCSGDAQDS